MSDNSTVYIDQLNHHVGQEVTLQGWLYKGRASGKVQFLIVRDGTGLCQCVVEKGKVSDELFETLKHLGQESSLTVTGTIRADERSVGGHELAATGAAVIAAADGYPITPKAHGVDFLMRHRHLHFRSQRQWCIGKIRHTVVDESVTWLLLILYTWKYSFSMVMESISLSKVISTSVPSYPSLASAGLGGTGSPSSIDNVNTESSLDLRAGI